MADHTHIEWTDATWNPITGCSVISAGCKHCYAMKLAGTRLQHHPSRAGLTVETAAGPVWNGKLRFNARWLDQPLRWRRPRRIFVCAHGDLFHEDVPIDWIDRVWGVMASSPRHTFQVLTKRAARMQDIVPRLAARHRPPDGSRWPLPNVWLGVSVEDQAAADARIPLLLQTPAAVRWVSAEPLLGPVRLADITDGHAWRDVPREFWVEGFDTDDSPPGVRWDALTGTKHQRFGDYEEETASIDWVVAGGESGRGARPMHPDWVRSLRDQCATAGVPFLFKQWGNFVPGKQAACGVNDCYESGGRGGWVEFDGTYRLGESAEPLRATAAHVFEVGKIKSGRTLDGELHDGYPGPRA